MEAGDKVVCAISGLESFGITQGKFYTISRRAVGPLAVLIGPTVSLVGFDDNVFFSENAFRPRDTSFEDELIKKLKTGI